MFPHFYSAAVLALLAAHSVAQTTSNCWPLNSTCPDDPALGTVYQQTFNTSIDKLDDKYWNVTAGPKLIHMANEGAQMKISSKGDSVTAQTSFYIFFGEVEIEFQAASGAGIISTMNLLSDVLDEIDVEVIGSNTTHVSTNWYGQGNMTQNFGKWFPVDQPAGRVHKYRVAWGKDQLQWFFDDQLVRTEKSAGPKQYPQTPSYIKMGVWSAGDSPNEGTVQWAGGKTDWTKGPYTMTVKSIKITDADSNKTSYSYPNPSDGSWQSIKENTGKSPAATNIEKPPEQSTLQKYEGMSTGAKIAIAATVLGVFALAAIAFLVLCCRKRRQGAKLRKAEDQAWEREQTELAQYRTQWGGKSEYSSSTQHLVGPQAQRW